MSMSRVGRARAFAAGVLAAAVAAGGFGADRASAQAVVTSQRTITITVNLPGQLPESVTGYRAETICRNVFGLQTPNQPMTVVAAFPRTGGTVNVFFPLQVGSNCVFRLYIDGTGPRQIGGSAITVGGVLRPANLPTVVDGNPVEFGTVVESLPVPVEDSTTVVFGQVPTPTTTTSTTTTSTTTTTTSTTTTRPPATTTTAPPATAAPTTAPPTTKKVTTTTKPRYRRVCTTKRDKRGKKVTTCKLVRIR